jgi:DNA-binding MarR family transcriptional regulator
VLCSLALASVENRSTDITTIVADLAMPRSTVKRVLDLLTVHGDVRLERSSDDRRRVMVIPSEQSMRAFFATLNELITATQALAAEFQK